MKIIKSLKISCLVDDHKSWIVPYVRDLVSEISRTHDVCLYHDISNISEGDCLFILGCKKMIPPGVLARNKRNIVIHESGLPSGRGLSPLAWQVLEGKNEIPVSLFEATDEVDAGHVYMTDVIKLNGNELLPEIRALQGAKTIDMALMFIEQYDKLKPVPQKGEATYYRRRTREDDYLDPSRTVEEQFDKLRIVDNGSYPARIRIRGHQ